MPYSHIVVALVVELRTEHDVPQRVGLPLQPETAVPAVGASIFLAEAIAEIGCRGTHEVLRGLSLQGIAISMVPAHMAVNGQMVFLLVVQIDACHLGSRQSLSSPAPAASVGESHVVDVVGIAHQINLHVILHPTAKEFAGIALMRTDT